MIAVVLALWIAVPILEPRLAFFPRRHLAASPDAFGLPFEEFNAVGSDGVRVHGWFIPGASPPAGAGAGGASPAAAGPARLTILMLHGNAENIGDGLQLAAPVHDEGWNLLLLDYRGYGKSEGSPSEAGIYRDGEAALAALRARADVDPGRIVVWGRSVGAAVAVHLAAETPVRGVVLESPFTSVDELLREGGYLLMRVLSRFGSYRFDSAAKMPRVGAPVLVIHGTRDEIVPFHLGRRLCDLAPGRKEFLPIEGGGHNDLWARHGAALWEGARGFLASLE